VTSSDELAGTPLARRTVTSVLRRALERTPDAVALASPLGCLSYAEAWTSALGLAAGLRSVGVRRGEPVLLLMANHVDNVLAWFALALSGAVEVPVNTSLKGDLLDYLINNSGARSMIVDAVLLDRLEPDRLPNLETLIVRPTPGGGSFLPPAGTRARVVTLPELADHRPAAPDEVEPHDLMTIAYTSGTTGRSKGVLVPHAHAWTHASAVGRTEAGDIRFVVLPQFHIAGQWGGVYRALLAGATAYVAPGFHASTFLDEVRLIGATTTQLVGTMAAFLTAQPVRPDDHVNPLREVHMIPMVRDVRAFADRFGVHTVTGYGNTEVGTVLANNDPATIPGLGSPRPGYQVRLVDEHDREVSRGQAGECVVRADIPWTTMLGYHAAPEKTAEVFRNGWLHSGDALRQDADGHFHFVDRTDDSIRRRGENVSSLEVETAISQHPAVLECAAVAVPSEHLEDEIKAVVVPRPGEVIDEEELVLFLAERLPYFMVPRYVSVLAALPKTQTAKVRKSELRLAGVEGAWDCQAAGLLIGRDGTTRRAGVSRGGGRA
jgi:carnitine-CoA ligase